MPAFLSSLVVVFSLLAGTNGELACAVDSIGGCLTGMCPPGSSTTCIVELDECCPDGQIVNATTTTTTTTPRPTTKKTTTCVDLPNPNTGVSDCPKMASYCTNAVYYDLMTKQCPKTCGRCTSSGGGGGSSPTCVDKVNPSTGVSDCTRMASYCNNSAYYTLMTDQCPKTCGRCTSGTGTAPAPAPSTNTCVDLVNKATGVSDCSRMAGYCNDSVYYTLMTQQCPRTCGRCPAGKK